MNVSLLKSKIHRATVTEANLFYEGSLTVDVDLLKRANMYQFEKVHVVNINNGHRLITYLINGEPGSGTICLNGAAARLGHHGDKIIIISYGIYEDNEAKDHKPIIVLVDEHNKPI
ncbi:MAG: aspartate 1-decarboxylase [Spirochaetia bacterium]|nr:aspartate 1-decarboxylase [Spirochaetia bacterium]